MITDETNICIVEFNYYIENYTIETTFSHVISAESYTASWIIQLSSDSSDINIILDPDQVYMNTQTSTSSTLSASKVITTSSCESTLQQLGIYIGAALFALFLLTITICIVAISFCCVHCKHREPLHPNTYTSDSYSSMHQYPKGSLPSLPDNEIYAEIEDEYI